LVNYHFIDVGQPFEYHDRQRSEFIEMYAAFLASEPGLAGRTLDVGCGHGPNRAIERLLARMPERVGPMDGVDPFPMVEPPAHLVNRWTCPLEDLPVEPQCYAMAHSYNVVEHVENVDSFLGKVLEVIKPGSAFWSMSPNARHPFTWMTRLAQFLGLKRMYVDKVNRRANDYPAYYRLSNDREILASIERQKLPVSQIDFYYVPNVQWDTYFPARLRFIAHALDQMLLLRMPRRSFIFMFRLQKAGK